MSSSSQPSSPDPANRPVERDDDADPDAVRVVGPRDLPVLNGAAAAALLRLLERIPRSEPARSQLVTPAEAAKYLRTSVGKLANDRHHGVGPSYVKYGRRVLYTWDALRAFIEEHTVGDD
ncbi:helix-turn-helix domain-containing protein [Nocardia fluminea]|uniref:helix-turn-helix domain-containing protein n=1 Tax=Nocardia fluminea TaxID=134984 RepID=UPI00366C5590